MALKLNLKLTIVDLQSLRAVKNGNKNLFHNKPNPSKLLKLGHRIKFSAIY